MTTEKTAWVAGASGLVGGALLTRLLDDTRWARVVSFGRRPVDRTHPRLTQVTVDFARFDAQGAPAPTAAFCTLGTTIKKAGSREAFRAVDYDAVMAFARAARAAGATDFHVVTALGAKKGSWVFYNHVKGEVEAALATLGFDHLVVYQPSLLLGDRAEQRPGERAAIVVSEALAPVLRPFASRPIHADTVAAAVATTALAPPPGVTTLPSGRLHDIAAQDGTSAVR